MKNSKFFTTAEAEALIGFLENTLERIRRNKQQFLWLEEDVAVLQLIVECGASEQNPDAKELGIKRRKHAVLGREIEKDIATIEDAGCVLHDVDEGVVDFYSIQDGTVIFLSWKIGEDSIKYWRSTQEGGERQRLARSPSKS